MRKYLSISKITARSRMAYIFDFVASSFFLVIILFVFIKLWTITLKDQTVIEGFDLKKMIWYYVATETLIMSLFPLHRTIEKEIREGDVAIRLNKPYSYLAFHYSVCMTESTIKAFILLLVGSIMTYFMVGPIAFDLSHTPAIVLIYLVTTSLNFLFSALIGMSAFWTEDVSGLFFIFDRLKWLLGGFLLPITIFPEPIKTIAMNSPFHLMIYSPAKLFIDFSYIEFLKLLLAQVGLFAVMTTIAGSVYYFGIRKLNLNGG